MIMEKRPFYFDAKAFLNDMNRSFEEEEFMHDFKRFLSYVAENEIRLTPKNKWIPMKHVYAINALFRNPLQLDDTVGNKTYKTREEWSARRIYFIDLLAEASECIVPDVWDVLIHGPVYNKFLDMNGFDKKRWLVFAWWFHMYWEGWMPQGDFGRTLREKTLDIIPYIKEVSGIRHMVDYKKFARTLINDLNLKWIAPSQEFAVDSMQWGIERCILLPLEWFEIIRVCYKKEDAFGIKKIKGFYIKPKGKIFLDELAEMGEKVIKDMAR